jgi:hypothetical protein
VITCYNGLATCPAEFYLLGLALGVGDTGLVFAVTMPFQ